MTRRTLIGTGLAASFGAGGYSAAEAAPRNGDADGDERVAAAITELRRTIEDQGTVNRDRAEFEQAPWRTLARIREQQRTFLRATERYPDFIEVGIQVWESLYDWHIQTHQPATLNRRADGRYIMLLGLTTIVLRPEFELNYVGPAFDADRATR